MCLCNSSCSLPSAFMDRHLLLTCGTGGCHSTVKFGYFRKKLNQEAAQPTQGNESFHVPLLGDIHWRLPRRV